mmetsp:Transcript_15184/g.18486  ORF Transcript_15184/g.18486 Transcript_15184/m.18486 type:complete len:470 (+) Transcript_15184:213-1622(+)
MLDDLFVDSMNGITKSRYDPLVAIIPLFLILYCLTNIQTEAYINCSEKAGGGICPDNNTCCLMKNGTSGCIASDMGSYNAICCRDGNSGCPVGYICEAYRGYCFATDDAPMSDPLVLSMPRYRLCNGTGVDNVYGFQVEFGSELAYYSSHGPIERITKNSLQMVLVVIHGALRNGDDYFCSSKAAIEMQTSFSDVLIISVQFFSEVDERSSPSFLYWEESTNGPWRYGINSIGPGHVSSFEALDVLVQYIFENFPSMIRLTISGHSSGGQFVQRWALLTPAWVYDKTRVVVANPSSYAYLSPHRLIEGQWKLPSNISECPLYNTWEWGLECKERMVHENPYVYKKLQNKTRLIENYHRRNVYYLVGSQDQCDISVDGGWCHSHGLEITCMDEIQGRNRLERSYNYISYLRHYGFEDNHVHLVVKDVGHDHALMFQSKEGLNALFEEATERKRTFLPSWKRSDKPEELEI